MGSGPEALVVGGSIGGIMAAHALLKAGCSVTVLEKAPAVSSAGAVSPPSARACVRAGLQRRTRAPAAALQGLGLDPRTEEAMAALGLKQQLHQHSLPMPVELNRAIEGRRPHELTRDDAYNSRRQEGSRCAWWAAAAQQHLVLCCMPAARLADARHALSDARPGLARCACHHRAWPATVQGLTCRSECSTHWSDIHQMLLGALPDRSIVRFGHTVTGFERQGARVTVSATRSAEGEAEQQLQLGGDLLIAADGSMSGTRAKLTGSEARRCALSCRCMQHSAAWLACSSCLRHTLCSRWLHGAVATQSLVLLSAAAAWLHSQTGHAKLHRARHGCSGHSLRSGWALGAAQVFRLLRLAGRPARGRTPTGLSCWQPAACTHSMSSTPMHACRSWIVL